MKDLEIIYNKFKDKYNLKFTTTFALNDGYTIDVPVIRGVLADRRFDLYKEDDMFVFSVEFFEKQGKERFSHAHPYDVNDAIIYFEDFMSKKPIFDRNKKFILPLFERKKLCKDCKSVNTVKLIKDTKEFFNILEQLENLIDSGNYYCDGNNNPKDTMKFNIQDDLWYRIKCKKCGTIFTLWYDTFKSKGNFKRGK